MTESMLRSLMKLYALLATINVDATKIFSRNFVESFLKGQFSARLVERSLIVFDEQMDELTTLHEHQMQKRLSMLSVKILMICNEINHELHLKSKFLILFSIIQFARHYKAQLGTRDELRDIISDVVKTISDAMLISESEFNNCNSFITDRFFRVPDKKALLVVSDSGNFSFSDIKHFQKAGLEGQFFFLQIPQADLYIFYYSGREMLELGGKSVFPNHIYVFPKGSSIKGEQMSPIYYGDIVTAFRKDATYHSIELYADSIDFTYANSQNGIRELSMTFEACEMVGVMGGSGAGKSTLMSILNGTLEPDKGDVFVNGYSVFKEKDELEGIIGFVPQDDLLIEELTVFENLYYNAKLCLGDLSEYEIIRLIGKVLNNLGLFYIKDLKVGSPLKKYISGGQRKRLNIALELIREPYLLYVDEPTSGLSSTDSENVLTLLKEQALSGKIVVVNIHQPSSDLFKLFDKIIILDRAGYPVYVGNPLDSISYLKNIAERADAAEIECVTCGTVQTDDILKIIEAKKVNEFGEFTKERLLSSRDWYALYKDKIEQAKEKELIRNELPPMNFKIPSRIRQFFIYSSRNYFSKIADQQFVVLALGITPLLALIVAFFTKYLGGLDAGKPEYVFSLNDNIPSYLFMSVIVSLFVGMIISAEEIIRDRRIRARESFLNLSKASYLNSKIAFLFLLSAFQMLEYVLIGNTILGIKGLYLDYWLILFPTSCFAVLLGLNISAGMKSVISIYINIPFILVPLILLSGVIVKYDKLHPAVSNQELVPVVGDVMASRWAYEALVVNQFKNNKYEKHFFEVDREQANVLYYVNFLIPELKNRIEDLKIAIKKGDTKYRDRAFKVIQRTFPTLEGVPEELRNISYDNPDIELMTAYLNQWKAYLVERSDQLAKEKDRIIKDLTRNGIQHGQLVKLKQDYHNDALADLVLNSSEMRKILEIEGRLVRKDTPIFQEPSKGNGRTQFFSATKRIGKLEIDTIMFNIVVIWLMTIILYIALYKDILRKSLELLNMNRGQHK